MQSAHFISDHDMLLDHAENSDDSVKRANLDKIFSEIEDNEKKASKILILGEPGVGKTILTYQMAYRWAIGNLGSTFDFILHITLSSIKGFNDQSNTTAITNEHLAKFIIDSYLSMGHDLNIGGNTSKILTKIFNDTQIKILFILDGYDEVVNQTNSFQKSLLKKILAKKYVIISSRPHFIQQLKVDKTFINVGFKIEVIPIYIQKYLESNSNVLNSFMDLMKLEKSIALLSKNPLCLQLICDLYDNFQQSKVLSSLVNIYAQLNIKLLRRYYELNEPGSTNIVSDQEILSNAKYDEIYYFLNKLAFTNFTKNNYIFELNKSIDDLSTLKGKDRKQFILKIIQSGFIKPLSQDYFKDNELNKSFKFLHLTIQEFYVSQYIISCLMDDKKTAINEKFGEVNSVVKQNRANLIYINVFRFVIGTLAKDTQITVLSKFLNLIFSEENDFNLYRLMIWVSCINEIKVHKDILNESSVIRAIYLCVCNLDSIFKFSNNDKKYKYKINELMSFISQHTAFVQIDIIEEKIIDYFTNNLNFGIIELFFSQRPHKFCQIFRQKISKDLNILSDGQITYILSISIDYLTDQEIEQLWKITESRILSNNYDNSRYSIFKSLSIFSQYIPEKVFEFLKDEFTENKENSRFFGFDPSIEGGIILGRLVDKLGIERIFDFIAFLFTSQHEMEKYAKASIVKIVTQKLKQYRDHLNDKLITEIVNIGFYAHKDKLIKTKEYGHKIFILLSKNYLDSLYSILFNLIKEEDKENIDICLSILKMLIQQKLVEPIGLIERIKQEETLIQITVLVQIQEIRLEFSDNLIENLLRLDNGEKEKKVFLFSFIIANLQYFNTNEISNNKLSSIKMSDEVLLFATKKLNITLEKTYDHMLANLESESYLINLNTYKSLSSLLNNYPLILMPKLFKEISQGGKSLLNKKIKLFIYCLHNVPDYAFNVLGELLSKKQVKHWSIIQQIVTVLIVDKTYDNSKIFKLLKPHINKQNIGSDLFTILNLFEQDYYQEIFEGIMQLLTEDIHIYNYDEASEFINQLIDKYPNRVFDLLFSRNIFILEDIDEVAIFLNILSLIAKYKPTIVYEYLKEKIDKFVESLDEKLAILKDTGINLESSKKSHIAYKLEEVIYFVGSILENLIPSHLKESIKYVENLLLFNNVHLQNIGINFAKSLVGKFPNEAIDLLSKVMTKYLIISSFSQGLNEILIPLIKTHPKEVLKFIKKSIKDKWGCYLVDILNYYSSNYLNELIKLAICYEIQEGGSYEKFKNTIFKNDNKDSIFKYLLPKLHINDNDNDNEKKEVVISILSNFDCSAILHKLDIRSLNYKSSIRLFSSTPFSTLITKLKAYGKYFFPVIINKLLTLNIEHKIQDDITIDFYDLEHRQGYRMELTAGEVKIFNNIYFKLETGLELNNEDFIIEKSNRRCGIC